jgi:hypothetical protein
MSRAEDLTTQIVTLETTIEAQKALRDARMERVTLIDNYIVQLEKRKLRLKAELQREEATLIRPEPTGVVVDGWQV